MAIYMKIVIIAIVIVGYSTICYADRAHAVIKWDKTLGGDLYESGNSVIQTYDGGYIVAGTSQSKGPNFRDIYIVKLDLNGKLEWENTYGPEGANTIRQTKDSGFVIIGHKYPPKKMGAVVYLLRIDRSGNRMWDKEFGYGFGNSIEITKDGGFIITGHFKEERSANKKIYLLKTDSLGNIEWESTFGKEENNVGNSVIQTNDGGFVVCGQSIYTKDQGSVAVVIKTDSFGQLVWENTYGDLDSLDDKNIGRYVIDSTYLLEIYNFTTGRSIIQTCDSEYVFVGEFSQYYDNGSNVYIVKIDQQGNVIWEKSIGGKKSDIGFSIGKSKSEYLIVTGFTNSNNDKTNFTDCLILKLDINGELIWKKEFGGKKSEYLYSLQFTKDDGMIFVGQTSSKGKGDRDIYLLKTDSLGNYK